MAADIRTTNGTTTGKAADICTTEILAANHDFGKGHPQILAVNDGHPLIAANGDFARDLLDFPAAPNLGARGP
jgi:hypothetical protein